MKRLFIDNWKFAEFDLDFSFDKMVEYEGFKNVNIPHDYQIEHVKDLYKDSFGFYRKEFEITPEADKVYILRFEGVYMDAHVYLNGEDIFQWKYGYSTFDVDMTVKLRSGKNEIYVVCKYQSPNTRWYSGAGIYRNVYFIEKPKAHICMDGCYFSAVKEGEAWKFTADCDVSVDIFGCCLRHTIIDSDGSSIATLEGAIDGTISTVRLEKTLNDVRIWDIDDPHLYKVKTELIKENQVIDTEENSFGFRTIEFNNNEGFFLNGRRVQINGACQHHDLGALGAAVNKSALRRQLKKLMKMGVNSVRTSHNMPSTELMELCDEMGILVCSEAFDMWEKPKTEFDYSRFFVDWWEKDVTSWVKRDRNHPSVIIWSIGNEIYDTHAGNGLMWTQKLSEAVRKLDYMHNAYIGIGSNYIEWEGAQKCAELLELSGYNYGERLYDEHHKKYPHWCIFGSETSSTVQSRGIYHFPYEARLLTHEDRQCSSLGNCTTNWGAKDADIVVSKHRDRKFVSGQYIWTGWDYIGEPTPYSSKNSYFGQIDTAGFEKDTYYLYQAEWTDVKKNPMVHLLPYWDFNEGQIIDVCAYTNGASVELFVNGESKGRKEIDHNGDILHARWKVSYIPGKIEAVAYDKEGNIIARDEKKSFGEPTKIVLHTDTKTVNANGEDLIFAEISVVDKDGNEVQNARNRVNVKVEGPGRLLGLDNGDSTDYEEYKSDSRKLFSGKLLAIVAPTFDVGKIKISVTGNALCGEEITVESVSPSETKGVLYGEEVISCGSSDDIPVRKIVLKNSGSTTLTKELPRTTVQYEFFPKNTTYPDIYFKAMTLDGIEANFVNLTTSAGSVEIEAIGDGEFKLVGYSNNGKEHAEVFSELEFSVTGLGKATMNPYEFTAGILCAKCSHPTKLSFDGGVFVDTAEKSWITFENVDFGQIGSDEVTVPVFSFEDEMGVSIWEGQYGEGKLLGEFVYSAKSIYNVYQPNTFSLTRKIRGLTSVTFCFDSINRYSVKGFSFKKYEKAYEKIDALNFSSIVGDSFTVGKEAVTSIGNNVSIDFDDMNFALEGVSAVEICGRSNNEKTSVHIVFEDGERKDRQLAEMSYSKEYETVTVPLSDERTAGKVSFVFLPGSNFDFKWFRFVGGAFLL